MIAAIILGIVQGLTEFLPISSNAHVLIASSLLHYPDPTVGAAFTAVIQLGTLLAVIAYFRRDLARAFSAWIKSIFSKQPSTEDSRMGWAVFYGTIPVAVFGFAFHNSIEHQLRSLNVIAVALIAVGVLMSAAERFSAQRRTAHEISWSDGIVVGFFQALALIPGCSRSGSTISGSLVRGFNREVAARFSFLLSIPAVLFSGIYELIRYRHELLGAGAAETIVATAMAFVFGYWSIDFLLKYLRTHSLTPFVVYRIAVAIALLVLANRGIIAQ